MLLSTAIMVEKGATLMPSSETLRGSQTSGLCAAGAVSLPCCLQRSVGLAPKLLHPSQAPSTQTAADGEGGGGRRMPASHCFFRQRRTCKAPKPPAGHS